MATKNERISFPRIVKTLAVGESHAKVERVLLADVGKGTSLNDKLAVLRNFANQAVARVKKETGSDFRVETIMTTNSDRDAALLMAVVTRLEDIDI